MGTLLLTAHGDIIKNAQHGPRPPKNRRPARAPQRTSTLGRTVFPATTRPDGKTEDDGVTRSGAAERRAREEVRMADKERP